MAARFADGARHSFEIPRAVPGRQDMVAVSKGMEEETHNSEILLSPAWPRAPKTRYNYEPTESLKR